MSRKQPGGKVKEEYLKVWFSRRSVADKQQGNLLHSNQQFSMALMLVASHKQLGSNHVLLIPDWMYELKAYLHPLKI